MIADRLFPFVRLTSLDPSVTYPFPPAQHRARSVLFPLPAGSLAASPEAPVFTVAVSLLQQESPIFAP
jgi:hypothetical protein